VAEALDDGGELGEKQVECISEEDLIGIVSSVVVTSTSGG